MVASQAIAAMLGYDGIVSEQAETGEEAFDLARHYDFEVIVIALALRDIDGVSLIRRMRSAGIDTPVLALSGLPRQPLLGQAFAAGADDFLTKPFDHAEFLARAKRLARRTRGHSQAVLEAGALKLNMDTREVIIAGTPVAVTGKEYAILELLVLRKGSAVTKETLLNHLYNGMDEPEAKIIDVFICKLRKKLAQAGAPNAIGTVWGHGYVIRGGNDVPHASEIAAASEVRQLLALA